MQTSSEFVRRLHTFRYNYGIDDSYYTFYTRHPELLINYQRNDFKLPSITDRDDLDISDWEKKCNKSCMIVEKNIDSRITTDVIKNAIYEWITLNHNTFNNYHITVDTESCNGCILLKYNDIPLIYIYMQDFRFKYYIKNTSRLLSENRIHSYMSLHITFDKHWKSNNYVGLFYDMLNKDHLIVGYKYGCLYNNYLLNLFDIMNNHIIKLSEIVKKEEQYDNFTICKLLNGPYYCNNISSPPYNITINHYYDSYIYIPKYHIYGFKLINATIDDQIKQVLFRIIEEYNDTVHQIMADINAAPILYMKKPYGLSHYVLIMEYNKLYKQNNIEVNLFENNPFVEVNRDDSNFELNILLQPHHKQKVLDCLTTLHNEGYVHGDLLATNIFVGPDDNIWINGYEKSGRIDEILFPLKINNIYHGRLNAVYSSVKSGKPILPKHEIQTVNMIFNDLYNLRNNNTYDNVSVNEDESNSSQYI